MSSGQALVVSCSVHVDMSLDVISEMLTNCGKDLSITSVSHSTVGKVSVHACAIPVSWYRFGSQVHGYVILLTETHHEIPGDPDLVSGFLGTFVEYLILPRAKHDLGICALDVETGINADVQMLVHNVSP